MFKFDISDLLRKKLKKLVKKDKILSKIFHKKICEVISHNKSSIKTYKNLKSLMNEYKRIHLTDKHILLFKVNEENNKIIFVDILHWDKAYKK